MTLDILPVSQAMTHFVYRVNEYILTVMMQDIEDSANVALF